MINLLFKNKYFNIEMRERYRVLIVFIITIISIFTSLLITFIILLLSNTPFLPIIFIIAIVAPSIISPLTSWFISDLIIKAQKLEQEHWRLATFDDLTGLLSRRAFLKQGEELLRQSNINKQPLALAFLDLDKFKLVNDIYGHAAGDSVLTIFADVVRKELRPCDLSGRLGGEEFAIILPNLDTTESTKVLDNIKNSLQQTKVSYFEDIIRVTVSIGLVTSNQTNEECQFVDLLKQADEALYIAKDSGRNKIIVS